MRGRGTEPASEPQYDVHGFYGSVMLKGWMRWRDGRDYIGFTGKLTILQDEELVGFKVNRSESNWVVRVDGTTDSVNLLGCQVRGVTVHGLEPVTTTDFLVVP